MLEEEEGKKNGLEDKVEESIPESRTENKTQKGWEIREKKILKIEQKRITQKKNRNEIIKIIQEKLSDFKNLSFKIKRSAKENR